MNQKTIVTAEWLNNNIDDPKLIILDTSMNVNPNGSARAGSELTIANARHFDLEKVFKDTSAPFSNTVPKADYFAIECQKLGINQDSKIVIFDNSGVHSSPRAWWLFKLMGHENVAVLNGGFPAWQQQNFDTVEKIGSTSQTYQTGNFKANFNSELLISFDDIVNNAESKKFTIIDARSAGRFNGTAPEPRKHLQSGSITHSLNLPYQQVLVDGKFKSAEEINKLFTELSILEDELVFSCGSGLTACIIMLASEIGFKESKKVYDGSWTEWAELNHKTISEP